VTSPAPAADGIRAPERTAPAGVGAAEPLVRLQDWLLRHAADLARGATLEGFRLYLHPVPHPFYRNTAVPLTDDADWPAALLRLRRHLGERQLPARIECFAELFPRLARALESGGFRIERSPAMLAEAHRGTTAVDVRVPDRLAPAEARGFLDAMLSAFGGTPARRVEVQRLLACHLAGRLRLAWRRRGGRILAGAALGICGDTAELMGVFTATDCRGQGHARAVCTALGDRFARGGGRFLWLAAEDAATDLYARLGFRVVGTRLEAFALPLASA